VPDDYAVHFREGFKAYCYQYSPNPAMQMQFERKRDGWLGAIANALRQGDREQTDAGFIPDRTVVSGSGGGDIGPAWPFAGNAYPGR
jgi:hypothetical protein